MYQEFWEDFGVQLGGRCGQTVDTDLGFRFFAALHSLKENS